MNKWMCVAILACLAAGCSNYEPVPQAADPDAVEPGTMRTDPTDDAFYEALQLMKPGEDGEVARKDYREAVRLLQIALVQKRHPEPAIRRELGMAYFGMGMYSDAIDELRLALLESPNDAEAQLHLGLAYMEEGDFASAVTALRKATRLDEGMDKAWYNLGVAQLELGNLQKAQDNAKRAIEIDDDRRLYLGLLALTYEKQERIAEAIDTWKRVLRLREVRNDRQIVARVRDEIDRLQNKADGE